MEHIEPGSLQHVIDWNKRIAWYYKYIHEIDQVRRTLELIREYFTTGKTLLPVLNYSDWHKHIAMVTQRILFDSSLLLGDIIWIPRKVHSGGNADYVNRKGEKRRSHYIHTKECMYLDLPDDMDKSMPDRPGNLGHILFARHAALVAGADDPKAKNVHLGKMERGVENDTRFWSSCYEVIHDTTSKAVGEVRIRTSDIEKDDNEEVMIGARVIKVESFGEKRVTRKVVRPDDHTPPWTDGREIAMTTVILAAKFDFILDYKDVLHRA